MTRIETFVFFDIETTGLPWQERNQTKITELSFVAALRRDIEAADYGDIPLVSKLTIVFNPMRKIHPEVVQLTGLSNDLLKFAPLFRTKVHSMLSYLEDLPKPVCLVAHNGNTFDFKIIQAEFNDAGAQLPADLLCVDSIIGFRKILKNSTLCYKDLILASSLSNVNVNSAIVSNRNTSVISVISEQDLMTDDEDEWPDLNVSNEDFEEIDDICQSLSNLSSEDLSDNDSILSDKMKKQRSEAIKKVFSKKTDIVNKGDNSTAIHKKDSIKELKKQHSEVVKKVFNKKASEANKGGYSMSALYKRLLNKEESNAHRAEVDCLMLSQCVVAMKTDFLPWADMACKPISQVKPLIRY